MIDLSEKQMFENCGKNHDFSKLTKFPTRGNIEVFVAHPGTDLAKRFSASKSLLLNRLNQCVYRRPRFSYTKNLKSNF